MQSAKCKILNLCTRASNNFYHDLISTSPPTCKVQSARSCTFAHVQVSTSYQDLISPAPPTCKVQSARSCTFAHVQVTILIMILFLHHLLPARFKVQDVAHLHTCNYQFLIMTLFLHHPLHAKCKVQDLEPLHTCK